MRLSVNLLTAGRYFRAFQDDVPDDRVPDHLRKFAVAETEAAQVQAPTPGTHIKRGAAFKRCDDPEVIVEPGEPTYRRQGKAFIRV